MNRLHRIGWGCVFVLSLTLLGGASQPVWAEDKKPVHLDILLPEDAELEINGYKTKSTGTTRRFESPPVEMGRAYRYTLKVSWHGHTLTRRTEVRPEQPLTLDLRKQLEALAVPKPAGSFTLLAPPALMLSADQHRIVPLRVKRVHFPAAIGIRFEDLPRGITIPEMKLSEGQSEGHAMLFAAADAPPGTHEIRVAAASGALKDVATIKVTIAKPEIKSESKPEKKSTAPPTTKVEDKPEAKSEKTVSTKVEATPVAPLDTKPRNTPSQRLHVLSPSRIVLHPGQAEYIEVKAVMEGQQPLPAEPSITLDASPESSLTCEMWTAFDFKAKQPDRIVGFALKASADSEPREQHVRVAVTAGTLKSERTITVRIQPQERKPAAKPEPVVPLQLVMPSRVELSRGKTAYFEIRVQTTDGSPLAEMPSVMLASPSDAGLRLEPWTSSFKSGDAVCMIGVAVTAETTTAAGDREARLRIVAGRSSVEQALKVSVKPSSPPAAMP